MKSIFQAAAATLTPSFAYRFNDLIKTNNSCQGIREAANVFRVTSRVGSAILARPPYLLTMLSNLSASPFTIFMNKSWPRLPLIALERLFERVESRAKVGHHSSYFVLSSILSTMCARLDPALFEQSGGCRHSCRNMAQCTYQDAIAKGLESGVLLKCNRTIHGSRVLPQAQPPGAE